MSSGLYREAFSRITRIVVHCVVVRQDFDYIFAIMRSDSNYAIMIRSSGFFWTRELPRSHCFVLELVCGLRFVLQNYTNAARKVGQCLTYAYYFLASY